MSMEEENFTVCITDDICLKGNPKANFTHTGVCLCGTPVYFQKDTSWEERWRKSEAFDRIVTLESFARQHNWGEYKGETVIDFIRQEREALLMDIREALTVDLDKSIMLDGWERYWIDAKNGRYIEGCIDCENSKRIKVALTKVQELTKKKI